jgi:hypothetical protein
MKLAMAATILALGGIAVAAESEYQDKMQEDLDAYKKRIVENCGTTDRLALRWVGKLGANPRTIASGDYAAVGSLCTAAVDGLNNACLANRVVKQTMRGLTSIVCQAGRGPMSYGYRGGTMTFSVDPKYDKNNVAGQESDMTERLKNDLDR